MNKLSIVSDGIYYSKENFKIKPNQSTCSYVISTIELLKSKGNLQAVLFDFGDNSYAIFDSKGTRFIEYWETLEAAVITPQLLVLHKIIGKTKVKYFEFEVLTIHSEMLNFLPIDSELKIKAFLNFVINVLNINYHPDDLFSNYLYHGNIVDINKNIISFNKNSCDWFDTLSELCLNIAGDKVYDWGTEIITNNLTIEQNLNESEMLHLCEDNIELDGNAENIIINNGHNLYQGRKKKPLESGFDVDSEDTTAFGGLFEYEFNDANFDYDTNHNNTMGLPLNEDITDVKVKKGKMHQVLGVPEDKEISDFYKSGRHLAQVLIRKVGRQKAAGMINYAANINGYHNIFDDAQAALSKIPKE